MLKDQVLKILSEHKGGTVSGAMLAERLTVTRSAVWKAIEELRAEGLDITAVTHRGYCLTHRNDLLNAEQIEKLLRVPAHIALYRELQSTSVTAKQLALAGEKHGTVVISDRQTAGRGRLSRSFFSPAGCGIYMSILLRPRISSEKSLLITAGAAVAVCRAVERTAGKKCDIKWVNDVYLSGRKICGILTEGGTDFETGNVQYVVVGIGVNVFPPEEGFPEELTAKAGTVLASRTVSRNELAAAIINEVLSLDLNSANFMEEYRVRSMVIGKKINVNGLDTAYSAVAESVTEEGYLIVRTENGALRVINSGEVSIGSAE